MPSDIKGISNPSAFISGGAFSIRLEKHLDDYRKGRGNVSKHVSAEVNQKDISANNILTSSDPSAGLLYGTYQSVFSYSQRARFVKAISAYANDLGQIASKQSGTRKN